MRKSCPFDHGTDRAVEVTATADAPPNRRQPILPPTHARIGCEAVLREQELATRPQDAPHLCEARIAACGIEHKVQVVTMVSTLCLVKRNGLGGSLEGS